MSGREYIPVAVVRRVRQVARGQCGYCRAEQKYVLGRFHIEHIRSQADGGTDGEENLWLSCSVCNGHKSAKSFGTDPETGRREPIFNPRTQTWSEHFEWSADKLRIVGRTPTGRATVAALHLDSDDLAIDLRRMWLSVGWHPPTDDD